MSSFHFILAYFSFAVSLSSFSFYLFVLFSFHRPLSSLIFLLFLIMVFFSLPLHSFSCIPLPSPPLHLFFSSFRLSFFFTYILISRLPLPHFRSSLSFPSLPSSGARLSYTILSWWLQDSINPANVSVG